MGHTHYWRIRTEAKEAVEKRLGAVLEDFARLLPHLPPLAGPDGTGGPVLYPPEVAFNGPAPDGDYESFRFPRWEEGKWSFGACKTGPDRESKRPYGVLQARVKGRAPRAGGPSGPSGGDRKRWTRL